MLTETCTLKLGLKQSIDNVNHLLHMMFSYWIQAYHQARREILSPPGSPHQMGLLKTPCGRHPDQRPEPPPLAPVYTEEQRFQCELYPEV